MSDALYVATDREGIGRALNVDVKWDLPKITNGSWTPGEPTISKGAPLVLRNIASLLDALDEEIFVAEALEKTKDAETPGTVLTKSARLSSKTSWDTEAAAHFALDCAEHVSHDVAEVRLPDGTSLGDVIAQARKVLETLESDDAHNLSLIARLSAARRLRKRGAEIGDFARELLAEDVQSNVNALDDPAYTAMAALVDAVLGAVEAIRSLALPRYVHSREEPIDEHSVGEASSIPRILTTPWGPIAIGAEHRSPYAPSWAAARDAAGRARDAMIDRSGREAGEKERSWQARRLEGYLHSSALPRGS